MKTTLKLKKDAALLALAQRNWDGLALMRRDRRRCKNFTYGNQLSELVRDADGRVMTEEDALTADGVRPMTNNLIRQLVRSIVGRYRYMRGEEGAEPLSLDLDARALEEFLISGVAFQRLNAFGRLENVSPDRMICSACGNADGADVTMVGALLDMPAGDVAALCGGSDAEAVEAVRLSVENAADACGSGWRLSPGGGFHESWTPGMCRVIDLWHRSAPGEWTHTMLSPSGDVIWLSRHSSGRGLAMQPNPEALPPYFVRFYPYIDGEIHSLVSDVIDQQRYVNRLISLLDRIIASSAKGVLLYPADQLPDGFSWRDIRRLWSSPQGILPFKRTSHTTMPRQVVATAAGTAGASEMLKTQLQLFDEIAGVSSLTRLGRSSAAGEGMLRAEMELSNIAVHDILASFECFTMRRDAALKRIV